MGAERGLSSVRLAAPGPPIELELEIKLVREAPPRLEDRSMKSCRRSTPPLACGSRGSQKCQSTFSAPQKPANSVVGRPAEACSPDWRSQTSVSGSAPNDHKQRRIPNSSSGVCLEKTSVPAPARE